jgi:hypothetical protein
VAKGAFGIVHPIKNGKYKFSAMVANAQTNKVDGNTGLIHPGKENLQN